MDILEGLNPSQLEAVTTTEGIVRVIAGAGSGKTRALSHRFAYLVNEIGIMPSNILCVTFTNKSAEEMRKRIHNLIGDNDTGYINTFHGFCVSILQEDSNAVGYPKSFLVLDNSDIDIMLSEIYEERGLTLRDMTFSSARDMIEIMKIFKKPDYYLDMIDLPIEELHERYMKATDRDEIIFLGYLYRERKCFALDYNDLIFYSLYIFDKYPDIREKWQMRLEYIMIDEFQDIDEPQYRLMKVLCDYHKNLFIVGDPDQTIYTWRGANVKYLLDFDRTYPETKTVMMMENYRSTPEILSVANSLIDKNINRIKKNLIPTKKSGDSVVCFHGENSDEEAMWIAGKIAELNESGISYRDMTVMYRVHYITRVLEEAFIEFKIPYTIYSGTQFFDRKEIRDTLAYLRMILYKDDLSFQRIANVPKRNLGKRRMEYLKQYAENNGTTLYEALKMCVDDEIFSGTKASKFISLIDTYSETFDNKPVSEVLAAIIEDSGYEKMLRTEGAQDRLDNLAELKQSVYDYENSCGEEVTLEHYLNHIALLTAADTEEKSDKVKMMTVHAAKGLEFPCVFLCGMNEGIFPTRKTKTFPAMEEERRLAFVAVTRAKEKLFISEAEGRNFDGSPRYPSRFILDIDKNLLEFVTPPREGLIKDAAAYISNSSMYLTESENENELSAGQRVRHKVFGEGTVVAVDRDKSSNIIKFDNMPTTRAISQRIKLDIID